jgi:uncharacterized protein (DUF2132 family)
VTKDSQSKDQQPNNPLHGLTLEAVVTQLVDSYGFPYLAERVKINCFKSDPSIKSSLKFLRRTLWAREQVEKLFVAKFIKAQGKSVGTPPKARPKPVKTDAKPVTAQPGTKVTLSMPVIASPSPVAAKPKPAAPKPKAKPQAKSEAKSEPKPNPWASGAYKKP